MVFEGGGFSRLHHAGLLHSSWPSGDTDWTGVTWTLGGPVWRRVLWLEAPVTHHLSLMVHTYTMYMYASDKRCAHPDKQLELKEAAQ